MRWWTGVSAGAAPIVLIGGWTLAASRQPVTYDPVRDTISALAGRGAIDAWIMTIALAVLGLCHMATACGLSDVGATARAVLGLGGLATVAVAALPQPNAGHVPAATVGFVALSLWSATVIGFARRFGLVASVVLTVLLIWLGFEINSGDRLGLSERVLAGAQALVPLAVVALVARGRNPARTVQGQPG